MSDTSAPMHPRQRQPDTAVDPASLTQEQYVALQLERSRLKADANCAARATHLLDLLRTQIGQEAFDGLGSILCVGCRNRHELDAVEQAGFTEVVGIDLHSTDPRIRVMDMHRMSFEDGRFDVVLASHSLEHAKDPARAGAELRRVTAPGGYILIEVPIYYGTRGADLWDFRSPQRVLTLLGSAEPLWMEECDQPNAPQEVARLIARAVPGTEE